MFYYLVESSHWANNLEFCSRIKLDKNQCFRITSSDSGREYPTRFKVLEVREAPQYHGRLVTINEVDLNVDSF